jgi:hypothetical protein
MALLGVFEKTSTIGWVQNQITSISPVLLKAGPTCNQHLILACRHGCDAVSTVRFVDCGCQRENPQTVFTTNTDTPFQDTMGLGSDDTRIVPEFKDQARGLGAMDSPPTGDNTGMNTDSAAAPASAGDQPSARRDPSILGSLPFWRRGGRVWKSGRTDDAPPNDGRMNDVPIAQAFAVTRTEEDMTGSGVGGSGSGTFVATINKTKYWCLLLAFVTVGAVLVSVCVSGKCESRDRGTGLASAAPGGSSLRPVAVTTTRTASPVVPAGVSAQPPATGSLPPPTTAVVPPTASPVAVQTPVVVVATPPMMSPTAAAASPTASPAAAAAPTSSTTSGAAAPPCSTGADCALGACGRLVNLGAQTTVCCPSGQTIYYGSPIFAYLCTGQPVDAACPDDALCASGVCTQGICRSGPQPGGSVCDSNIDCIGACIRGICTAGLFAASGEACDDNEDCATGVCGRTTTTAAGKICCPTGRAEDFSSPINDSVCTGQLTGAACVDSNTLCQSGACFQGICQEGKQTNGQPCDNNADCVGTCIGRICTDAFKATGAACDDPDDCASNACGRETLSSTTGGKICCPTGLAELLGAPISDHVCTGQEKGAVCRSFNALCQSGACVLGLCE